MRLEDMQTVQMREITQWADSLDEIITPAGVTPKTRHDYPKCLAICEKLKRVCQIKYKELKKQVEHIEDVVMDAIEQEKIVLKLNKGGMPEYRKKFSSQAQRDRESRIRLAAHPDWERLATERDQWHLMAQDWMTHHEKLRREADIIEADYLHNGGQSITMSKDVAQLEK